MALELIEAKLLIKNLLKRLVKLENGTKELVGVITEDEVEALELALSILDSGRLHQVGSSQNQQPINTSTETEIVLQPKSDAPSNSFLDKFKPTIPDLTQAESAEVNQEINEISLNESVLYLPELPPDVRVCLDFGTAMSKATLVNEAQNDLENIEVLHLGIPGDQEQVSQTMLVSSVYIDNEGLIWFGQHAVEKSLLEGHDGLRQRIDNIKRTISEDGLDNKLGEQFNPTKFEVTYKDMVLAYLMFFTWATNQCTDRLGYPRNLPRRFAMPCFDSNKQRATANILKTMLGQAQVLADTFELKLSEGSGLDLDLFLKAVKKVRHLDSEFEFITEAITEPLGVASSLVSWDRPVDMLAMVVDVGAGTSDFSLNRIHIDPENDKSSAHEIKNTTRGITQAGNHLDRILIELMLKKADVKSNHPNSINIRGQLMLSIRDYKESLFLDNEVFVVLPSYNIEFSIDLEEFMLEPAVTKFGDSLRQTMMEILEGVNASWFEWVASNPTRRLTFVLTGGGANLPMVKKLAEQALIINGLRVEVAAALAVPNWLKEAHPNLEEDYPRIAVSLGGARKRMIERNSATITTSGVTPSPSVVRY